MVAGANCLRVGGSVDAGLSPIDVLERCDRRGDIFSGRAVVFIEKVFARRFGRDHPESVALRGEFDDLKEKLAACRLRAQLASTQQRPREDSS